MELNTIIARINNADARISKEQYAIARLMLELNNSRDIKSFDKYIKENNPFKFSATTAKSYLLVGRLMEQGECKARYHEFVGGKDKDGKKHEGIPYTVVSLLAKATKDSPKHFNADKVAVLCKSLDIVAQYNETKAKAFNKACAEDGYKIDAVEYHERLVRYASDDATVAAGDSKQSDKAKLLAYIKRAMECMDNKEFDRAYNVLNDAVEEFNK